MSHTKPAPVSGLTFDFATDEAPLDLSLLRQHDYGRSLMDRAQRQRETKIEFGARADALREQAATSPLPHEAQLAALDRESDQIRDTERTQTGYRRLRERYDPDELDRSLQSIAAIPDPVQQRASLTQLQASYAGFAFNPELAQRMDAQFAEFEPVVQRREQAALLQSILAGRYAPTLADARQIYPGRKINTLVDPTSRATVFVPEKIADPDLEAEAVQVIQNAFHLAKVTGNRSHLEAALDDPAVRQVSRIPGNQASIVVARALEEMIAPPPPIGREDAGEQYSAASNISTTQPSPNAPATTFIKAKSSIRLKATPGDPEDPTWTPQDRIVAKFSDDVYGKDGETGGLLQKLGISYKPQDGFAAALYRGEDGKHYLAFRGTQLFSLDDWVANIRQGLGYKTSQYEQATTLARQVQQALRDRGELTDGDDLIMVGHSLGGGLASAASRATGQDAVTLNAAGLGKAYLPGKQANIRAHYIGGEILSRVQDDEPIMPDAVGTRVLHPSSSFIKPAAFRHVMTNFHTPEPRPRQLPKPRLGK